MLKKIFFLLLALSVQKISAKNTYTDLLKSSEIDEKKNTFSYFSAGAFSYLAIETPVGGPTFGVGVRSRIDNFGCGASFNAATYTVLPYLAFRGELLYFFSDNYYTGLSGEIGLVYVPGFFGSEGEWELNSHPEILIGRQTTNQSGKTTFANIGICPPQLLDNSWTKPSIFFRYGIGF